MFVRLMRDAGFDFVWDDKYSENLFANCFEHKDGNFYEAITTFETFEHFVNPLIEVENMLRFSNNIIFSTELLPEITSELKNWWYLGLNHGQHISFYSYKTLTFLAQKYDLHYMNLGSLHILSKCKIKNYVKPLSKLSSVCLHVVLNKLYLTSKINDDHTKALENE